MMPLKRFAKSVWINHIQVQLPTGGKNAAWGTDSVVTYQEFVQSRRILTDPMKESNKWSKTPALLQKEFQGFKGRRVIRRGERQMRPIFMLEHDFPLLALDRVSVCIGGNGRQQQCWRIQIDISTKYEFQTDVSTVPLQAISTPINMQEVEITRSSSASR